MSYVKSGNAVVIASIIMFFLLAGNSYSQTHFTFTSNTGNNMTVLIQSSINPTVDGSAIANGDEIGVFTPAGLCVGAAAWTGANIAVTVWGDNDQTTVTDGAKAGDTLKFRVWDASATKEVPASVTYTSGGPTYSVDGIAIAATFAAVSLSKPTITPKNQTKSIAVGGAVTVAYTVTGNPSPASQWYKGGVIIAGATNPGAFPVSSPVPADSGDYSLIVSNSQGTDTAFLKLVVLFIPKVGTEPAAQTKYVGDSVSFSVVVAGNPAPTYQWRKDGVAIGGATDAKYKITAAALGDSGIYSVIATNSQGSDTSLGAKLTVKPRPAITIVSPNGGETLYVAKKYNVTWTSRGDVDSVKIELSVDSGATWTVLAAKTVNDGSDSITVPNSASSKCLMRISAANDSLVRDASDAIFSIVPSVGVLTFAAAANTGLHSVGPNPMRNTLSLSFGLSQKALVTVEMYSLNGILIRKIAAGTRDAGSYTLTWDGCNGSGKRMNAGLYVLQLNLGGKLYRKQIAITK
jgi:hypothetical protein